MATPADTPYGTIAVPIEENVPGHDVPTGGTTGQALVKNSNADYDVAWQSDTDHGLPVGGSTNEVLTKASNADYDVAWDAAPTFTLNVDNQSVSVLNGATTLDFVGAGVVASDAGGGIARMTIPGSAPDQAYFSGGDVIAADGALHDLTGLALVVGVPHVGASVTITGNVLTFHGDGIRAITIPCSWGGFTVDSPTAAVLSAQTPSNFANISGGLGLDIGGTQMEGTVAVERFFADAETLTLQAGASTPLNSGNFTPFTEVYVVGP